MSKLKSRGLSENELDDVAGGKVVIDYGNKKGTKGTVTVIDDRTSSPTLINYFDKKNKDSVLAEARILDERINKK